MLICLGERGSLLVRHTNTVTCSAVYIWSHSGPAYWKLFICGDTGEADPPHMFSLTCRCQHVTYFPEVFCFDVSFICISLILSSPRLFLRPCVSTSPRPLGAVGPIQARGLVLFQIQQHAPTGRAPTCFSSAAEMKRLLSFFFFLFCLHISLDQ